MDREAEDLSHEEVCRHLDVLTPAQIKALRELYQLTQAQFSKITKLGEATLSRWERGILVQNNAYDNYLYLLGFKENLKRICDRSEKGRDREQLAGTIGSFQFRELDVNEELLERQSNFELIKV
jgi:DNA-binding transcriptional regulator YiaG